ncbi:hypothetical protein JMUB7504_27630 [Staphylococcus aureus]
MNRALLDPYANAALIVLIISQLRDYRKMELSTEFVNVHKM